MPSELDIFPLGTTLFPLQPLPLQIFEPRYLAMIKRCCDERKSFGICAIESGAEVGAPAIPHKLGCEARIIVFGEVSPQLYTIAVLGGRRFRLERLLCEQPSIRAQVAWLDDEPPEHVSDPALFGYRLQRVLGKLPGQTIELPDRRDQQLALAGQLLRGVPTARRLELLALPGDELWDAVSEALEAL